MRASIYQKNGHGLMNEEMSGNGRLFGAAAVNHSSLAPPSLHMQDAIIAML